MLKKGGSSEGPLGGTAYAGHWLGLLGVIYGTKLMEGVVYEVRHSCLDWNGFQKGDEFSGGL